mmetsp:Transcript_3455/g.13176  ORF Transcript_3455/g.13176 Transcript_3455/m.13176 type:complete len:118 (+) Transcript_3455:1657-2010(+)
MLSEEALWRRSILETDASVGGVNPCDSIAEDKRIRFMFDGWNWFVGLREELTFRTKRVEWARFVALCEHGKKDKLFRASKAELNCVTVNGVFFLVEVFSTKRVSAHLTLQIQRCGKR